MGQSTAKTEHILGPRLREGAFIGVSAVCLYMLLALLSYSVGDPGWSGTGAGARIANMGGPTGAWMADVCFSLVGYAAYLVPVRRAEASGPFGIPAAGGLLICRSFALGHKLVPSGTQPEAQAGTGLIAGPRRAPDN